MIIKFDDFLFEKAGIDFKVDELSNYLFDTIEDCIDEYELDLTKSHEFWFVKMFNKISQCFIDGEKDILHNLKNKYELNGEFNKIDRIYITLNLNLSASNVSLINSSGNNIISIKLSQLNSNTIAHEIRHILPKLKDDIDKNYHRKKSLVDYYRFKNQYNGKDEIVKKDLIDSFFKICYMFPI